MRIFERLDGCHVVRFDMPSRTRSKTLFVFMILPYNTTFDRDVSNAVAFGWAAVTKDGPAWSCLQNLQGHPDAIPSMPWRILTCRVCSIHRSKRNTAIYDFAITKYRKYENAKFSSPCPQAWSEPELERDEDPRKMMSVPLRDQRASIQAHRTEEKGMVLSVLNGLSGTSHLQITSTWRFSARGWSLVTDLTHD